MKFGPVTPADLRGSVIAVPPLANDADHALNPTENERLLRHLEAGGVTTALYGGNANIYNIGQAQYRQLLESLPKWAADDTWVIPSVGPSFGQMMDQIEVVREMGYPTAMALPLGAPATQVGTATGLRKAAERLGRPIVLYLKWDGYLSVDLVASLVDDGLVCAIKYAIVRSNPLKDDYLSQLLEMVDPSIIVSGIGERPAVVHLRDFGLQAFTSGSVCVAPRQSTALLHCLHGRQYDEAESLRERFLSLEDLRDGIHPIRVLHDAVTESAIATMGPILPLLSNLVGEERNRVREAARELLASEDGVLA